MTMQSLRSDFIQRLKPNNMQTITSNNANAVQNNANYSKKHFAIIPFFVILIFIMASTGCKKTTTTTTSYQKVNLVADSAGWTGARVDTNLKNAWGIALYPNGNFWISANHANAAVIYDRNGVQQLAPVMLNTGGAPSGAVYNSTADFRGSKVIFANESGVISAYITGAGDSTVIVADRSATGTVYKGLAIASDGGANFLYATDFHNGKVDVFDANFNYVTTKPFVDPSTTAVIPSNFAPFNIYSTGGQLYVTYAMHKAPDNMDDQKGAGNGYVNVFNPNGTFVKRFASQGTLNSPWAIAAAPSGFGLGDGMILIGNFGDGRINVFDANGNYKSQLMNSGTPIAIDGLWGLQFPVNGVPAGDQNQLFFTAGPNEENHGLFGYLSKM